MITGSILRTIDSPVDFPETLANMELLYSSENALHDYLTSVKALSANEIIEAANKYLTENILSSAVILPK
jgi:predicted Zn-dependent peptidase